MPLKSGRPQHSYYLSQQGRDLFPQNYGDFAVSFLDTMAETVGEKKSYRNFGKTMAKKSLYVPSIYEG